jgi:pilus assembly protein CpaC
MLRNRIYGLVVGIATILPLADGMAQQARVTVTPQPAVQATQSLILPLNKSQVLRVSQAVSRIAVGNPDIVDAVALTDRSFYVLGKGVGTTNISVYGANSQLLAVIDAVVTTDVAGIKAAIREIMPNETVDVRSVNDSIALSGVLSSPAKILQAVEIAGKFAAKEKIINDLRIKGTQQVMLQVKVAEMSRHVSKALGFKPFVSPSNGNLKSTGFALSTLDPVDVTRFAVAAGQVVSGNFVFSLALDALEEKGAVKILAEPNLVAMSGDTASFLAGGEFPIPVAQTNGIGGAATITVEFKAFGVSLAFTPTVIDGDLINLVVAPEVSQIDKTTSVNLNGLIVPGIATRRAKTTVELRDGQSFAVAGLLQSDFTDQIRGIPFLADVPVLGALFRSPQYQRNETELVIIVTPKLVQPAPAGTLIAPTDSFVPPSDAQFFIMGRTESPDSGLTPIAGGGLTGRYGHIIR